MALELPNKNEELEESRSGYTTDLSEIFAESDTDYTFSRPSAIHEEQLSKKLTFQNGTESHHSHNNNHHHHHHKNKYISHDRIDFVSDAFDSTDTLLVVSSLMFGFGVQIWFSDNVLNGDNNLLDADDEYLYAIYCLFLSFAIGAAGSCTITLATHYYQLKLLLGKSRKQKYFREMKQYAQQTKYLRFCIRALLGLSMLSFYVVLIVYGLTLIGFDNAYHSFTSVGSTLIYTMCAIFGCYGVNKSVYRKNNDHHHHHGHNTTGLSYNHQQKPTPVRTQNINQNDPKYTDVTSNDDEQKEEDNENVESPIENSVTEMSEKL